jgi:hypothetical protein
MRLSLFIDGIPHQIDTTDPDLMARWLVEIFGRIQELTPATLIEFRTQPSFLYGKDRQPAMDWIADSAIIGQQHRILSPRDFVTALGRQLDEAEALANG